LWREQQALGYPMASLLAAGVPLRFGSDAPVAPLDPWKTIAAAVHRTGDEREAWRPQERVGIDAALRASSRHGEGSVELGAVADLVLCGADPRTADPETLRRMPGVATLLGGRLTHRAWTGRAPRAGTSSPSVETRARPPHAGPEGVREAGAPKLVVRRRCATRGTSGPSRGRAGSRSPHPGSSGRPRRGRPRPRERRRGSRRCR